jgi:hypothetical protein
MGIYYQDNTVVIRVYSDSETQEIVNKRKQEQKLKHRANCRYYEKSKRQSDPLYKLRRNIRSLIGGAIKNRKFSKNSKTADILGCSYDEFKIHIEKQFVINMSWDNYGQWEFDHVIPISWANSEEEITKLNHYTNFQPLWRTDNLLKSNKKSG